MDFGLNVFYLLNKTVIHNAMKKKATYIVFGRQHALKSRLLFLAMTLAMFLTVPTRAATYGLTICGVQVTDDNCSDLSVIEGVKKGSIAYYPYTKQLLIKELVLETSDGSCIRNESIEGLTIEVSGECNMKSIYGHCMLLRKSTTLKKREYWQGTSSLNLSSVNFGGVFMDEGEYNISDLNLTATGEYGIVGFNTSLTISNSTVRAKGIYGSITDLKSLTLNDVKIIEPEGVTFEDGMLKKNGEKVTEEVVIVPYEKYGLRICDVQISAGNKDNLSQIEGVKSGTITYDTETKTLLLKDVVLESETACIVNDSITGLTVEVEGECKVTSSKWVCFYLCDTTSFVSIGAESSLTLNSPNKAAIGVAKNVLCSIYKMRLNTTGARGLQGDDGTSSTLYIYHSYVHINGTRGSIYNFASVTFDCCGAEGTGFRGGTLISTSTGKEMTGDVMIQPIYYTVSICGVKITEENKNNLSQISGVRSGTIAYDTETKTLLLKDADLWSTDGEGVGILNINLNGLTIEIEGDCKITATGCGILTWKNITITNKQETEYSSLNITSNGNRGIYVFEHGGCTISNIDLTVTGKYGLVGNRIDATLNIKNSNVYAQGSSGSICNFMAVTLDGCEVVTPAGATFVNGSLMLNGYAVNDAVVISRTTSGIKTAESKESRGEGIYTIDGMRLNAPFDKLPRGIYIVNGRKVIK